MINDFNKESLRIIKKEKPELFVMAVPDYEYQMILDRLGNGGKISDKYRITLNGAQRR